MANILTGVEICREWTRILNEICTAEGGIERDDTRRIWDPWLHQLTNTEWDDIWACLDAIRRVRPDVFTPSDLDTFYTTRTILDSDQAQRKPRVMDTRDYKSRAWRQMCSMREVINRYNGVEIANNPPSKYDLGTSKTSRSSDRPTPLFNEIFTSD